MDKDTVQQNKRRRKPPQLQPSQQGKLDGLCGIYSIINAVRLLCKEIKCEESFALFQFLTSKADKHSNLSEILTHGLTPKEFKRLLKQTRKWLKREHGIKLKAKRYKTKNLTLKSAWRDFDKHFNQNGIILIGFTGKQNHYSVISGITPKTLVTFDSNKIQLIRKSLCSTRYNEDRYSLEQKEIFLISRKLLKR